MQLVGKRILIGPTASTGGLNEEVGKKEYAGARPFVLRFESGGEV